MPRAPRPAGAARGGWARRAHRPRLRGGVAAVGGAFLDALDISPETFRLAAALVLALEGARALLLARPATEPELAGSAPRSSRSLFPLLLTPGVVALALAAGGDDMAGEAVGALAITFAAVVLTTWIPRGERADALLGAGGRLLGAAEIAAGIALAVDSLHDV